jgi:sugar O-acyltransferase (sialic acid O-acetyltransferase NeuD family)
MTSIILIGGGGHCRSCIDVIETIDEFEIVGVIERRGGPTFPVLGYPVIGDDETLGENLSRCKVALITVGQITDSKIRERLYDSALSLGAQFPVIVSPMAYVSRRAKVHGGSIVMHGATVNAGANIGENCIVNSQSLVEHDVVVGSHSHISTGARVNGGVTIGKGTFIGSGAVINQGLTIGAGCVIGSGSIIRKDVPRGTQVTRDEP